MMKCPYCKSELNEGAIVCHVCRKKVKKNEITYIIAVVIILALAVFGYVLSKYSEQQEQKRLEEWRNSPEGKYASEMAEDAKERLEKAESLLEEIENIGKEYGIDD